MVLHVPGVRERLNGQALDEEFQSFGNHEDSILEKIKEMLLGLLLLRLVCKFLSIDCGKSVK